GGGRGVLRPRPAGPLHRPEERAPPLPGEAADQDRDLRGGPGVPAVLRGDGGGDERSDALTGTPGGGSRRSTGAAVRWVLGGRSGPRVMADEPPRDHPGRLPRRRPLQPGRVRALVRG